MDSIFPSNISCVICNSPISKDNELSLCVKCFEKINFIEEGCPKCGAVVPFGYDLKDCPLCINEKYHFKSHISCIQYDDIIHKMIYGLKYGGKTYLAPIFAKIAAERIESFGLKPDIIIPVPLSKKRIKKRGFNQALMIVEELKKYIDFEIMDIVERKKDTKSLAGLEKGARKLEIRDAFLISNKKIGLKDYLNAKVVMIFDDIFTTGSTTSEISRVLVEELDLEETKIIAFSIATGRIL